MVKGIVFDKDGTLLEYESFWVAVAENAIKILIESHKIENKTIRTFMDSIGVYDGITGVFWHGTYADIAECFNKETGHDEFTVKEVTEAFCDSQSCGVVLPTCNNITEVFKKLKDMGISLSVVTTDVKTVTDICLEKLGIKDYFDYIYTDDGVNPTKPDPHYMNCFMSRFNLTASEVLMVGDTLTDMMFAKNSGVKGVAVAKKDENKRLLQNQCYALINDISEIFDVIERVNNEQ